MVYVYAGLGIAMLSGIMAIFEMGVALTGQSLWPAPADSYFTSGAAKRDRDYLLILNNGWDSRYKENKTQVTCAKLNEEKILPEKNVAWDDGPWSSSCKVVVGKHRILVEISDAGSSRPHQLYSCYLDGADFCGFE